MTQRAETTVAECSLTSCVWARFLIGSHTMPGKRHVHVFRCNPPTALWQNDRGLFTCHCGSTGVKRTPIKSQHTKLTLQKKILPPLLPGFELATFRSRVRRSYQQAIPAPPLGKIRNGILYRIPRWALHPSSFVASFRSDHHVLLYWLVERPMIWRMFQHVPYYIWLQLAFHLRCCCLVVAVVVFLQRR